MIVGHEDKVKIFKRLVKEGQLGHGYLFFGERGVGKATFAKALASFLETGEFVGTEGILREVMFVRPEEGNIGIDEVRAAKAFLSQKPTGSTRRVVIVDDAEEFTGQAQNAVLKIAEEPPASSLIIIVTSGIDSIYKTLQSRLQRIYFPRVSAATIEGLLKDQYQLPAAKAKEIAAVSLGRPGRAVAIVEKDEFQKLEKLAKEFMEKKANRRKILEEVTAQNDLLNGFVSHIMARLAADPIKNFEALSGLTERYTLMADFNTNKRLQLETALWNI